VTASPPEQPATDTRHLQRLLPRWVWGLGGLGLFLAGTIIGAVLMASVALYRQSPAVPAAAVTGTAVRPTATLPAVRTLVPPTAPPPTGLPAGPGVGQRAPDLELPGLDSITYTLSAYQGKTVILNFWASWCPPCREEWPELCAFAQEISGTAVVLLAINVEEPSELVQRFVGTTTLPFPVLLDTTGEASERYHVGALPTTFVISPAGLVLQVIPGNLDQATLARIAGSPDR
jgi:thiol-disulfide isomerase/thioredoxin